jgi:hypothetical protein
MPRCDFMQVQQSLSDVRYHYTTHAEFVNRHVLLAPRKARLQVAQINVAVSDGIVREIWIPLLGRTT